MEIEEEFVPTDEEIPFAPANKLREMERKLYEHERMLQEKDKKIRELERITLENKLESDIKNLVGQNIELLTDMKYIEKGSEKVMISRELNEMYRNIITSVDPKYNILKKTEMRKKMKIRNYQPSDKATLVLRLTDCQIRKTPANAEYASLIGFDGDDLIDVKIWALTDEIKSQLKTGRFMS